MLRDAVGGTNIAVLVSRKISATKLHNFANIITCVLIVVLRIMVRKTAQTVAPMIGEVIVKYDVRHPLGCILFLFSKQ